ncbi:MAG TPA: hypothetical protein VGO50_12290 [Pyrinomonadaceae bacterium]|jgi:hypothetical protein|nr:hypothetical protein [Pyrinomonadaceae bacterium]
MIAFVIKCFTALQTLLGLEPKGRSITEDEKAVLKKVFADTVDLSKIVVKEGKLGLMGMSHRAVTICNTIYIPGDDGAGYGPPGTEGYLQLLVHETVHVWQFQNGGADYITGSVKAQLGGWWSGKGMSYAYRFERGIKEGKSWAELGPEQQAKLIEHAYLAGFFSDPNARVVAGDGEDYTDFAHVAAGELLARRGAP